MSEARIGAVLFDLDGTILDTAPDLAHCANAMLGEIGRAPLPVAQIRDYIGKGVQNLVTRSLEASGGADAPAAAHALEVFERLYLEGLAVRTKPYPGVIEGLEALARAGIPMGCVTNKAGRFTMPLLERTGLLRYMGVVVSGDTVANKKPHPEPMLHAAGKLGVEPARALMVGDSRNDVDAARAAGCPVVVVPYGYREGLPVEALGADAVVASVEDVARSITMPA